MLFCFILLQNAIYYLIDGEASTCLKYSTVLYTNQNTVSHSAISFERSTTRYAVVEESLPLSSTMQRQSLTISIITKSIDDVILENGHFLRESKGLKLQRVSKFDSLNTISLLYFGISVSEIKDNHNREEIDDVKKKGVGALISFYIGYSTWDGRVLFVDELPDSNTKTFLQILSKISIRLGCTRMNWMVRGL